MAVKPEIQSKKKVWIYSIAGIATGAIICTIIMVSIMPSMMIVTKGSKLGFDETRAAVKQRIAENGWSVKGVSDISREINKAGYEFKPRVTILL